MVHVPRHSTGDDIGHKPGEGVISDNSRQKKNLGARVVVFGFADSEILENGVTVDGQEAQWMLLQFAQA